MVEPRAGIGIWVRCFWFLFIAWVIGSLFLHSSTLARAENAIQQAAIAANSCVWIIGAYVICRALDSINRR